MSAVIDITGVEKTYKRRIKALRGVDLQVGEGEIFGLLGPNGAGKSTLVKIMMTVISPSKCSGTVLGQRIGDKEALAQIGYLPEHHRFPPYLTGRQVLEHFGAMSGIKRKERKAKASELLELVGMGNWHKDKLGSYSKGMRQRVGLAQALMNDPKLVVLDEPTDGVDPSGRRDIRNILTHLKDEGRTIFLNSHLLSELEMVCDRVAIMVHGLVRTQGTIDELTADQSGFVITAASPIPDSVRTELNAPSLPELVEGTSENTLSYKAENAEAVQPIIDTLRKHGVVIQSAGFKRPSLEDLFMQVVDTNNGSAPGAISGAKGSTKPSKGAHS
ncbi:MAG: ABC transporter ATP-binding protein [Phycisphaerales bacterium]|nr:ABC transporter ATP-binding protein [Phycisphaerales bacterium]